MSWFSQELAELQLRRERLRLRSTELRIELGQRSQVLVAPLAVADRAHAGLQWLRAHPELPLLVLGLAMLVRPRRALRWAGRLWWGYGLWQRARGWWQALEAAQQRRG